MNDLVDNSVIAEDCQYITQAVDLRRLHQSVVLITGAAGFLGYNFLQTLCYLSQKGIIPKKVIALDNFYFDHPRWLKELASRYSFLDVQKFDIVSDPVAEILKEQVDYVLHMASIASPPFYRRFPLETIDANIWGLRRLLDHFKDKPLKGLLFFSSSEIYGDPDVAYIPTSEEYRGRVSCLGPRACYDESKRFGETLCYVFFNEHKTPARIVRPFNNYGPGMNLKDGRVVADFAKAVVEDQDIIIHSNGSPTRTFCYVADAVIGYWKVLFHSDFDVFNIGIEKPEVTVAQLAEIYKKSGQEVFGYKGKVIVRASSDLSYLKDNPQRRCPDISKARKMLDYEPRINVEEGVRRYLLHLKQEAA